jgi:hypothetical protein
MAYGKRATYRKGEKPDFRFMNEMRLKADQLSAEERRIERMVDDRPVVLQDKSKS